MTPAGIAAHSGDWIPAGLPWLACVAGKVYFEVTVVAAAGYVTVGWAGTSFSGQEVGDDKEGTSWGVVSYGCVIHRQPPPPLPQTLRRH